MNKPKNKNKNLRYVYCWGGQKGDWCRRGKGSEVRGTVSCSATDWATRKLSVLSLPPVPQLGSQGCESFNPLIPIP